MNFKTLKINSISSLNLDFVAFSLLVKKSVKNISNLGWKHFTFSAKKRCEKLMLSALKALIFFNRDRKVASKLLVDITNKNHIFYFKLIRL